MNSRQQALDDLLQGFLMKFGDTIENKRIISEEIAVFSKKKLKITIKDLDELEEILLYKLNPSKKVYRKYSLSPIDSKLSHRNFSNSPVPGIIKPLDDRNASRKYSEIPINSNESQAKRIESNRKYTRKDNLIFSSDYVPEEFQSKTISPIKYSTPSKRMTKKQYDE